MSDEKNEFENIEVSEETGDDFSIESEDNEDLISSTNTGTIYDWSTAPEIVKAPPRIDLNGKELTINKAEMRLPGIDKPWSKTKAGDKEFKYCTFTLTYDYEGQQEFYSGVRVFKREDGKYSHPTLTRDRKNQVSKLLGLYADFKKKDINEVSLKEFMGYLCSKPKIKIVSEEVINPKTNEKIRKNLVGKFL